ncbi:porin [Cupriavidus pampae]|uniref:Outer membrane porin protein n=1 Tax=Cupriavidus pampae TaxID=659251 RepID=A0ABM8WP27_9BURK|nr:porin [Cupriavidus pampae]CAG9169169.1 Outer membrane porin protein [Cupriavidus pampae]
MKTIVLPIAAACAMCTATSAFAQSTASSVTLYGIVDGSVEAVTHSPGGNGGTAVRVASDNMSSNRWGLRGVEDLGGGMRALFTLESGFTLDNGLSAQGNRLFGRMAYVGLQNPYGALTLGRQQTAIYDMFAAFDPFGVPARYSLVSVDAAFNGRADNMVKYTGHFGGLTAIGYYSFGRNNDGEVPGSPETSRDVGGGLGYNIGNLQLGVAYDQYQGNTEATRQRNAKRLAAGANYTFGQLKLFGGYRWLQDQGADSPTATGLRTNLYWLGATYNLTGALQLLGGVYYTDQRHGNQDPWLAIVGADYSFSKRTDVYTKVAFARNRGNSSLGVGGIGTAVPDENQTAVTVGIRHRF